MIKLTSEWNSNWKWSSWTPIWLCSLFKQNENHQIKHEHCHYNYHIMIKLKWKSLQVHCN